MREKIRGITKRGKIYWLTSQQNGRLLQMSLELEDYMEAVETAALILQTPEMIRSEHVMEWYEVLRQEKKNGVLPHEGTTHTYLIVQQFFAAENGSGGLRQHGCAFLRD